jgi:nucleoside-triphosphatase
MGSLARGTRFFIITGRPGVGKTTLFSKVLQRLQRQGIKLAGFVCPEVRVGGRRVGFRIISIDGRIERWLAHVSLCAGPRVGKYFVCSEASDVAAYVRSALEDADLVAIDEIGPMELKVPALRELITDVLGSGKPGLLVVHRGIVSGGDRIGSLLKSRGEVYVVNEANREELVELIYSRLMSALKAGAGLVNI